MTTQVNMAQTRNDNTAAQWNLSHHMVSERVLTLIENGLYEEADLLATSELLFNSKDAELWLAAGLARFQKGNLRTARAAFKMSAWLNDNALAREMLGVMDV
jgi:Flp pilus assembly protein TadD